MKNAETQNKGPEADFLGFAQPNLFVTSNSNTLRSRLYWLQAPEGDFDFLGGQS